MPRIHASSLEAATQRIGRAIFERAEAAAPSVLSFEYWQRASLDWLTRDPDLKMRLFRFIEVFPALKTREAIARQLAEYLKPADGSGPALPGPLALALTYTQPDGLYAGLVAGAVRFACGMMAKQFVCGSTPREAIAAVGRMRDAGMTFTLDVLGETVITDQAAREHQAAYIELIEKLAESAPLWRPAPLLDEAPFGKLPRVNISIKLSAIVPRFDPVDVASTEKLVLDRLRPILRAGRDRGVFVNVDMEHYAVKDLTLALFKSVLMEPEFRDWPHYGIVIQAYLRDAQRDMQELIGWTRTRGTPITVRLVKGAYWDYETIQSMLNGWRPPVWTEKWQSDAEFERVARLMLENTDAIRPAFASHNVRSIASVLAMEEALNLPPRTLELQMLTGMGDQLKRAVVAMGQRLRVYAPFGDMIPGMAYLIRRLIENTSNESFLRQSFGGQTPVAMLLRDPAASGDCIKSPMARANGFRPTLAQIGPYRIHIQDPDEDEYPPMEPFVNEPDVDLSRPEARNAMTAALAAVRTRLGGEYPAKINGEAIRSGDWHASRNPAEPREVIGRTLLSEATLVDKAATAARAGFADWSRVGADERAAVLEHAADLLHDSLYEFAAWQILEVGKTWREALGDVIEAIDYIRFYAREIRRLNSRPRQRDYPGESNELIYQPRGVVAVISPFCFPTALLSGMTTAALAGGNAVIVKPAREASVCAALFVDLLHKAGIPVTALHFLPGAGESVGRSLTRHPEIDMVAFTGSTKTGVEIIEAARLAIAGRHRVRHVVADMGGKNAIIVDDDADLDEAVQAAIASAFGYSGQKCTSCSRVIAVRGVYADFLSKLSNAVAAICPGNPESPGTFMGPLISAAAVQRVRAAIEAGKRSARCVLEGRTLADGADKEGHYVAPVIFADVKPDDPLAREEIFGPVLAVLRAETFADAVKLANDNPYALTGGVYSRTPSHIEHAKQSFFVGNLYVNRRITASRVDRQPFGGHRMSGLGAKTGGPDYLKQFMLSRTLSENNLRHGFAPATSDDRVEKSRGRPAKAEMR